MQPQDQPIIDQDTLQTRYRPRGWDGIIGQEHITNILKGIIKNQTYHYTRSYVFSGSAGSGKTSSSKIMANAIICDHEDTTQRPCHECQSCKEFLKDSYPDYIEVDAGKYNKVEDVNKLIEIAKIYPVHSQKYRIILVDEAHRLSNAAWDSMLKLLEDGKTRTIFMFATTEGDKIRRAIHSRSLSFQMKPLSVKEISKELIRVCEQEKIPYDIPSIESIAYANNGRMRDALKTLDMYYRSQRTATNISVKTDEEKFCEIIKHTIFNNTKEALELLDSMVTHTQNIGTVLCNAITAIYCYPYNTTSGIPESILSSMKTLLKNDIKKIIDQYMKYKPITYEQTRLFILIMADETEHKQTQQHQQKRQLFKSRQFQAEEDNDEI